MFSSLYVCADIYIYTIIDCAKDGRRRVTCSKCVTRHGDTAGTSGDTVGDPEAPLRYTTSRCWARQCKRLGRVARHLIVLVYVPLDASVTRVTLPDVAHALVEVAYTIIYITQPIYIYMYTCICMCLCTFIYSHR